jgi:hypothetical protein
VNAPVQIELVALDLLFLMLELLIESLEQMVAADSIVGQARDLQDAISSYRRALDGFEEDDVPF